MIEFGVLVRHHVLAISVGGLEGRHPHQRMVAMIDKGTMADVPVQGASSPDDGVLRRGGSDLEAAFAPRHHRHNDTGCAPFDGHLREPTRVIGWVGAVSVGPEQPLAGRSVTRDSEVDACSLDALGIIKEYEIWDSSGPLRDNLAASVDASAIRHDNERFGVLGKELIEKWW